MRVTSPVRYISTRGQAPTLGFIDAMLAGLARDGGLYTPETVPTLSPQAIRELAGLPYAEAAARIVAPYVEGEIAPQDLRAMAEDRGPEVIAAAYAETRDHILSTPALGSLGSPLTASSAG